MALVKSLCELASDKLPDNIPVKFLSRTCGWIKLCIRCKNNTVSPNENRALNYCYDCGNKCELCENPGRVCRFHTDFVVNELERLEQLIPDKHLAYRMFHVPTRELQQHAIGTSGRKHTIMLLCSSCEMSYNFCILCKGFKKRDVLMPFILSVRPEDLKKFYCCTNCISQFKCRYCLSAMTQAQIIAFQQSSAEAVMGLMGHWLVCFEHWHKVVYCVDENGWNCWDSTMDGCEAITTEPSPFLYIHHTVASNAIQATATKMDGAQTKNDFFSEIKKMKVQPITQQEALTLVENGLIEISRKDLINFLVYVETQRNKGVIVSFYDKTGVQWHGFNDVYCKKCTGQPINHNDYENMYTYETDCCGVDKYFVYEDDQDLYDIIMNPNHYCDHCFTPLYNLADVEDDSDYVCLSCDEDEEMEREDCD